MKIDVFRTKLVDGTEVIQEVHAKPKTNYSSTGQGTYLHIFLCLHFHLHYSTHQMFVYLYFTGGAGFFGSVDDVNGNKPGLEGPALGHLDWISALTLCQASRWYIITGSKDGVIKVWK